MDENGGCGMNLSKYEQYWRFGSITGLVVGWPPGVNTAAVSNPSAVRPCIHPFFNTRGWT